MCVTRPLLSVPAGKPVTRAKRMIVTTVKVYAVIKGYHAYKRHPRIGTVLRCEPDYDNPTDEQAMGVYDARGNMVGHVPATPVALHRELRQIYKQNNHLPITW